MQEISRDLRRLSERMQQIVRDAPDSSVRCMSVWVRLCWTMCAIAHRSASKVTVWDMANTTNVARCAGGRPSTSVPGAAMRPSVRLRHPKA